MEIKKIRNPFPQLWKVFKYEILNSYRVLLPVYAVLLAVSLIAGIVVFKDSSLDFYKNDSGNLIRGILMMLAVVLFIASFVVSIIIIEKRFQKGMLGDEAYLNLSLPVTMGEHVWGRALAAFVWSLLYILVNCVALLFLAVRAWSDGLFTELAKLLSENKDALGTTFIPAVIFVAASSFLALVMFVYVVKAIAHLVKKHRTLVEVIAVVVIIAVLNRVAISIFHVIGIDSSEDLTVACVFWISTLCNAICIAIFGVATQLILTLRLNLE